MQSVRPDVMTNVKNTVLLETQGPCGSVRRCRDDTVTHDTNAQVKILFPQLLASLPQVHQKKKEVDKKSYYKKKNDVSTKNVLRSEELRTCGE